MGVLAFELLTGRTPWSSLTDRDAIAHEIVHKVTATRLRRPRASRRSSSHPP